MAVITCVIMHLEPQSLQEWRLQPGWDNPYRRTHPGDATGIWCQNGIRKEFHDHAVGAGRRALEIVPHRGILESVAVAQRPASEPRITRRRQRVVFAGEERSVGTSLTTGVAAPGPGCAAPHSAQMRSRASSLKAAAISADLPPRNGHAPQCTSGSPRQRS